jgi:hypothetical protein
MLASSERVRGVEGGRTGGRLVVCNKSRNAFFVILHTSLS